MKIFPSKYTYQNRINKKYSIINNLLTGAVDIIENNILDNLLGNKFLKSANDNNPLSTLIERGYYYLNLDDEEKLFKELFNNFKIKLKKRPIKFVFCPTYICNLKCTYCFEKDFYKKAEKYLNESKLNSAFKIIKNFLKNNKEISSIELFGGEPLLPRTKDIVRQVLKFASENNIRLSIITNGVCAKDFVDILTPVKSLIDMLQITLDGPEIIHDKRRKFYSGKGSFKEITASINSLLEHEINANIRVNIDMENIKYLQQLYEFINKQKWTSCSNFKIQLAKVTDHSTLDCIYPIEKDYILLRELINLYDNYPKLENFFKFYMFKPLRHIIDILNGAENVSPRYFNCESNLIELYIFCPDGYIYTCPESIGNSSTAIGKYYPELEFFKDKTKMWLDRNITVLEKCKNCKFAPICGGGCPYSSILLYGNNLHPVCENFQEVLDTFFKFRGEEIIKKFM